MSKLESLGVDHFRDVTETLESNLFTPQMRLLEKSLNVAGAAGLRSEFTLAIERMMDLTDDVHPAAMMWASYQMIVYLAANLPAESQRLLFGEEIRFDDSLLDDAMEFFKRQENDA